MNAAVLSARNLSRNRFRTALTILGVIVAMLAFLALRTVVYAWTVAAEVAPKDRLVTRHRVTYVMPLPKHYVDRVKQVPGIKATTYANWFGGREPNHEQEMFTTLAVDTDTIFAVYSEMKVPPDQLAAWKEDRTGAIVGDVIAKKMGWKIGDKVNLISAIFFAPPDDPWTFTIRGIYEATARSVDRSTFMFHWNYLNDRLPERSRNEAGWIVSRVTDPSRTADVCQAIDRMFEESDVQTTSQDERSFNASFLAAFSAVLKAIDIVSIVILGIMMLVLGNTIAMGVRERTNEYGVLRALGFSRRYLAAMVMGESVTAGVVGGIAGGALAYPLIENGMGRWLEENMGTFFPFFRIAPGTAVLAMSLAVVLSAVAALIPAWQVTKLDVIDALRRVE
jgi:putative ABC transport system permease protein